MSSFTVVPVLDLEGGLVVHARAGARERYRPLAGSRLADTAEPRAVVAAFLALHPFPVVYLADLDAIAGRGDHRALLAALAARFPTTRFWVDAGIDTEEKLRALAGLPRVRAVLGSESQKDVDLLARARALVPEGVVLSLDWRADEPLDPAGLSERPELWPEDVIVMTLARVGTGAGPDLARLEAVRRAAGPKRRIWAAGGVRGLEDLLCLRRAGFAGALVATAFHEGRLGKAELARLAEA
ncbi:MAG: HisA/HisF-related TIM barrel protein [Geminicoccaceae bacterium]|nr:HisA/HisF-related TIM barrel protein [Geminicoccaceae bacterium]MCS7268144.1 HisA/HisF-related TIM barrel protein [Geminicoccaceae bacterium]MDW8125391.1 HisA/HisF-related TIM barrel protein [Geminicoccaceae bacterium]MDW8341682.1 HisA/HisF-related TIM barrel protein [Geminicoccaceae bacterium]